MDERLEDIAAKMVADGKGILAADESSAHDQETFRHDRHRLDRGQPARLSRNVVPRRGGDEATTFPASSSTTRRLRQKAKDGTPLVDLISAAGAVPGIKVDAGAKPLAAYPGETITEGLDGLRERLAGIPQARRPLRQMARRDLDFRRSADMGRRQAERPGARPLRGALPGSRHRADRRAGSADGRPARRPRHRPLLRRYRMGAADGVRRAL